MRASKPPGAASRPLRWAVTEMVPQKNPTVGDRVRIERDESRYPSKGTWPQFRGKTGTIVEINLGEYGVIFSAVKPRTDGRGAYNWSGTITWFQLHEVTAIDRGVPVVTHRATNTLSAVGSAGDTFADAHRVDPGQRSNG